jgi:arylsulfatase A-like enzyme
MLPNVLLVVLDTVRSDVIELHDAASATPTVAELARRGSALPRAYATASWTLPSHASIFTGMLPRQLGLAQAPEGSPQGARTQLARSSERMVGNVLRAAGYGARGWSTNIWASPHAGFGAGFDRLEYVTTGREERMESLLAGGWRARVAWAYEGLRADADDGAAAVRGALIGEIEAWADEPTFWFVNLNECHSPYLPPRPWNDLGPAQRTLAAHEARRYLNFEAICLYATGSLEIPPAALERMRHLYGRAAAYMDSWLADVLEALRRRGILEQTLVIVTSDHGENFGEGGLIAHGFSLDERLIHVPLVMAGPGAVATDRVFSLAELPAVIAQAAGITDHPWTPPHLPDGVAVAQYDAMAAIDDPRVQRFARKWDIDQPALERLCASYTAAVDGTRKLVRNGEQETSFDLQADPEERHRLPATASDQHLRAALDEAAGAAATSEPPRETVATEASAEELQAIERQMKLLGYM